MSQPELQQPDPNYKFRKIAEDAMNVAMAALDVYVMYYQACSDGITADREMNIKHQTRKVEAGARRLRLPVLTQSEMEAELVARS